MLKVVGASWLQTRISTYILVAVALLGIGAIVLGEFGSGVEKDGTYSATVFWNHKGGYRIDFWGQGNDLTALPRAAARAYYKTRIEETGWSTVEIETSPAYPDAVQAYAAGLLEGSLTWQLIHHHWYNTIGTFCASEENEERCTQIRRLLRDNTRIIRERADLLANEDPFWHMVRLFYTQLDGMETGWRFAVRRSRRSVDIDTEDFLWLAMASDLPESMVTPETTPFAASPISNELPELPVTSNINSGVILLKSLDRSAEGLDPLIVIAQNTVAPYAKMLRLLKRYTFGYHLSGSRKSPRVPTRSIVMSSYPGALSSHDEYYVVRGVKDDDDLLILAAIPLKDSPKTNLPAAEKSDDQQKHEEHNSVRQGVMAPVRIMAANRLATEARSWSRLLARGNSAEESQRFSTPRQWLSIRPKDSAVWLIEQHPAMTHAADYTETFAKNGFVLCHGEKVLQETARERNENESNITGENLDIAKFFRENITTVEDIRKLMRGTSDFLNKDNADDNNNGSLAINSFGRIESRVPYAMEPLGKFVYRADIENNRKPVGVIDTKIAISMAGGLESFEATSGPPFGHELNNNVAVPFYWSQHFPNISHIGQPDKFEFDNVVPQWIWF